MELRLLFLHPTPDEQKAFKKLIAMFEDLMQSKLQSEINSFERIPNLFEPDFLKNLEMSRQARITKKSKENEILLKKYRTPVVSTKKRLQSRKIPMTSKNKREQIFALLFFIRKLNQTRFH